VVSTDAEALVTQVKVFKLIQSLELEYKISNSPVF
jgi:hypothetical protein